MTKAEQRLDAAIAARLKAEACCKAVWRETEQQRAGVLAAYTLANKEFLTADAALEREDNK